MKIKLIKNWDISVKPPTLNGIVNGLFVGREKEVAHLENEILRKDEGAILVCGERGIGKTSFVYKALSDVKETLNDKLVLILVDCPADCNRDSILPALITRLYAYFKDSNHKVSDEIKADIQSLYFQMAAKNFLHEITSKESKTKTGVLSFGIDIKLKLNFFISVIASILLGILLALADKYLNLSVVMKIGLTAGVFFGFYSVLIFRFNSETKQKTSEKASQIYQFDNNLRNLEFEFSQIHSKLSNNKCKVVYVIDELDKFSPEIQSNLIKYLKNFYDKSNAIFIFISDAQIHSMGKGKNNEREIEFTYFTSRYFLSRPSWDDLTKFMNNISVIKKDDLDNLYWERFQRCLAFDADNDYFNLKQAIKSEISDFENEHPVIDLNVSNIDICKARFHKLATTLFDQKYSSGKFSEWERNDSLLKGLFAVARAVYSGLPGSEFNSPRNSRPNVADEMVRDFYRLLERNGAFKICNKSMMSINGIPKEIFDYKYLGLMPDEPADRITDRVEYEKAFLQAYERYADKVLQILKGSGEVAGEKALSDFISNTPDYAAKVSVWDFPALEVMNQTRDAYKILSVNKLAELRKDDVDQLTQRLLAAKQQLIKKLPVIFSNIVRNALPSFNLKIVALRSDENILPAVRGQLINFGKEAAILCCSSSHKQIAFFYNESEFLSKLKSEIENAPNCSYVNISMNSDKILVAPGNVYQVDVEQLDISLGVFIESITNFLCKPCEITGPGPVGKG